MTCWRVQFVLLYKMVFQSICICPLRASRSGLWVSSGGLLAVQPGPAGMAGGVEVVGIWGRPYGDFLMTHFFPPCCCTEEISRLHASPLCSIRQTEGGVFVRSCWFPRSPCCQDTERCRRADSYAATLQDRSLCTDPHTNATACS